MITNKDLNEQYSLFARNIKRNRKRMHLTQEQLAEACDISISYIKQIENEKEYKNITLTVMLKLSKALNTNITSLFK
jgi:transcriptional regulator with XRE-family HTH domain